VLIRAGLLERAGTHLRDIGWQGPVAIVADGLTATRYAPAVRRSCAAAGIRATVIRVPRGERAKTVGALARLWDALGAAGIGRDGGVIALGECVPADAHPARLQRLLQRRHRFLLLAQEGLGLGGQ